MSFALRWEQNENSRNLDYYAAASIRSGKRKRRILQTTLVGRTIFNSQSDDGLAGIGPLNSIKFIAKSVQTSQTFLNVKELRLSHPMHSTSKYRRWSHRQLLKPTGVFRTLHLPRDCAIYLHYHWS